MTAAQIQARVDAWLRARGPLWTGDGSGRRVALVGQWDHVSRLYGADSAAALGVLLGLVREAWGRPHASPRRACTGMGTSRDDRPNRCNVEDGPSGGWVVLSWVVGDRNLSFGPWRDSEVEALLGALEAAP